jgi:hypothetical protein
LPVHGRCKRRSTTEVSASVAAANITDDRPVERALRTKHAKYARHARQEDEPVQHPCVSIHAQHAGSPRVDDL